MGDARTQWHTWHSAHPASVLNERKITDNANEGWEEDRVPT